MTEPIIIHQHNNKLRTIIESEPDKLYLEDDYLECVGWVVCDEKGDEEDAEDWKVERETYDYDIVFIKQAITEIKVIYSKAKDCFCVYVYTNTPSPLGFDFPEKQDAKKLHAKIMAWWLKK